MLIHIDKIEQEASPEDGWIDLDEENCGVWAERRP
jgi:hypothetical protein